MKCSMKSVFGLLLAATSASVFAGTDPDIAGASSSEAVSPAIMRRQAIQFFREGDREAAIDILKDARTAYETILTRTPDHLAATRGLAMTLFDLGEYEAAQEVFKRMLALTRKSEEAEPPAAVLPAVEEPSVQVSAPAEPSEQPPEPGPRSPGNQTGSLRQQGSWRNGEGGSLSPYPRLSRRPSGSLLRSHKPVHCR